MERKIDAMVEKGKYVVHFLNHAARFEQAVHWRNSKEGEDKVMRYLMMVIESINFLVRLCYMLPVGAYQIVTKQSVIDTTES
jgi:hypothetical protein